jgi:hypothetical protein
MSAMPPAEISVQVLSEQGSIIQLSVRVREGRDETKHHVTLTRALLERLSPAEPPDAFVRRCFVFLLEREPKDSILRRFDISVIGRYFPDFETTIKLR